MPKVYEEIKKQYLKKGLPYDEAQKIAAKIYNTIRNKKPSMPKLSNKKGGE